MNQKEEKVDAAWHWIPISGAILLIIIVAGISAISAGLFDPKPVGDLLQTYQLNPLTVAAGSSSTRWLNDPTISGSGTIQLQAAFDQGEIDSGFGLSIGNDQDRIIIALSPVGYLTIQRLSASGGQTTQIEQIMPWQTWPHVHTQDLENEIWVDIEDDYITGIRINREILWQEKIPLRGDQIGVTAMSFGKQASFDFLSLRYYHLQE